MGEVLLGFKNTAPYGSPQSILFIALAVRVIVLILPADIDQNIAVLSTSDWPLFIALGVLGAGLAFVLYIIGLNQTTPAAASIVAMGEPVTLRCSASWC